jgi:hypothetical protein
MQQPADLFAKIDEPIRIAHRRDVAGHALDRLGDQVLVRHRDHRHREPDHRPDLVRPDAAGVDDDLAAHGPLVGLDAGDATAFDLDARAFTPVRILTPRFRAPAASDVASEDGSIRPSVGKYAAASTPSMLINGNSSRASRAEISVRGSPNVLAHPT